MIIDGGAIAQEIQSKIKKEIDYLKGRKPCLAVLLVGDHPASRIYVNRKTKACAAVGILSHRENLPSDISETRLLHQIRELNKNSEIDGILVQLPLPPHISVSQINLAIDPRKDVDGFHPINMGKILLGEVDGFVPCTPLGIKTLLQHKNIEISGKHVVIVGRSNIVGKPLAALLMQNAPGCNATVTVAHSRSERLKEICRSADILVMAVGKPKMLTADMVKENAVVIDVGINRNEDASLVGDVDFQNVAPKCSYITPVPGGVGPMTIAMLLSNTLKSYQAGIPT